MAEKKSAAAGLESTAVGGGPVEQYAAGIAGAMVKGGVEKDYSFDPTVIITIIGLIKTFIDMFQDCNLKPAQVAAAVQDMGFTERFRLRWYCNLAIPDWKRSRQVQEGFIARAKTTTAAEVEKLFAAAQ